MVLGMCYDSSFNYAMAGLYRTAIAVSALTISLTASAVYAADPPVPRGNVSVTVNPTTGYYSSTNSTVRLPNGVSISSASVPVVTKYSGGLQQTIPTGITIDAIKKSAPLPVVVRATTQSVKTAATRCLTSARCNVALILTGEGLQRLLDGVDWVMGEGGKIQKKGDYPPLDSEPDNITTRTNKYACNYGRPSNGPLQIGVGSCGPSSDGLMGVYNCSFEVSGVPFIGWMPLANGGSVYCYYGRGEPPKKPDFVDLGSDEIASGVDSNYTPEPSDWRALTPELELDDVEITSAPTLQGDPVTSTVYDADGNPRKVTQTNIWYDFDIRDNPSPRPSLDLKTSKETKTYEDGALTGTTTTNITSPAGSNDTPPPPDSLIDCDLFPTACAWFDWTQEEPTEPDDDLSGLLQEVPIDSKTYTITGGAAVCPAPLVLDLSVFGSREVSYQPLCDLASTMKFLYLALMSFAAAVLLNRSINRV